MEKTRIRGIHFLDLFTSIQEKFGPTGLEKLKSALSGRDRAELFGRLVEPLDWVDYDTFMLLAITTDAVLGRGDQALLKELAEDGALRQCKSIHVVCAFLFSPKQVSRRIYTSWKENFSQGSLEIQWQGDKAMSLAVSDFHPPLHHEWLQLPYYAKLFAMQGAKNIRASHPRCAALGDPACIFELSWD